VAIGIDPHPLVLHSGNQQIFHMTSDKFFKDPWPFNKQINYGPIDLAFIDGSHLAEDALNDFINIVKYCTRRSVVVFDDVLPYNEAIAARKQPPGDWTGDVWRVVYSLREEYGDCLEMSLVDVFPTGALVVWGFHEPHNGTPSAYPEGPVPDEIINRTSARQPQEVLESLSTYLFQEGL
jgi:hypothetical protein